MKKPVQPSSITVALIAACLAAASSATAQMTVSALGTQTINLNNSQAGIYRFSAPVTNNGVFLSEPTGWSATGETGRFSFITNGVTGMWPGSPTFSNFFVPDVNGNGATDNRFDNFQAEIVASPSGTAGDYAMKFNENSWADKGYIFKINNTSGAAIDNWALGLDTWFMDTNLNVATLKIAYATTFSDFTNSDGMGFGATFTQLASRTGTKTNAGLSALANIGGPFTASVPDGGSLYVAVLYDQNGAGTEFIWDNLAVTAEAAPPPPVDITTTTLPEATQDSVYPSQTMVSTGGVAPFTWTITSGNLPTGLTLSSAGVISGTPTLFGTSNFTVTVTDGGAVMDSQALSIVVSIPPPPTGTLVYEGFSYANGLIDGANGGIGWRSSVWEVQDDSLSDLTENPGLTYTGLQSTGGMFIRDPGGYHGCGRPFKLANPWDSDYATQPLAYFVKDSGGQVIGKDGRSLWLSALVVRNGNTGSHELLGLSQSNIPWYSNNQVGLHIINNEWQVGSSSTQVNSGVAATLNEVALVVMRYDFGTSSDSVTLYVNPTPGLASPNVTGVTYTTVSGDPDMIFRSLRLYPGSDPRRIAIDEIRMGASYADVTPTPSGSSYDSWATSNTVTGGIGGDSDNDGMPNGVEYFMGLTFESPIFTPNPTLNSSNQITWPKGTGYSGAYGTDYVIQTSTDLSTWDDVPSGDVNISESSVLFTLTGASPKFTRLKVTGPL